MTAARASQVVAEWLAQTIAEVSRVLAKPASSMEAAVVVSMMVVAVVEPPAPAPAPVPVVDHAACTVERPDPVRSTCWRQRGAMANQVQSWLNSWLSARTSVIPSTQ